MVWILLGSKMSQPYSSTYCVHEDGEKARQHLLISATSWLALCVLYAIKTNTNNGENGARKNIIFVSQTILLEFAALTRSAHL